MSSYSHFLRENTANTANTCWDATARRETRTDAESPIPSTSKCSKRSICIGTDDVEERSAIIEYDTGAPREWAEAFARVQCSPPLPGFSQGQWETLIDDGGRFLDRWAVKAIALGWTVKDCFGVDPTAPSTRFDQMGLVPLIGGKEIIAITEDSATLQAGKSRLTYRRRVMNGKPVWELIQPNKETQ